jgi:putative photosynthetic complex assembly protein 2
MGILSHPAVAALTALFVWWFSTGVVLYIIGSSRWTSRRGLLGAAVLFAASLYGLARSSTDASVTGAYTAFTCAVLLWGTQEFGFLAGFITGPRSQPCPEGCAGWRRIALAMEAIIYHEIALVVSGLAVVAVTWNADNQFGTWTFLILWAMRVSAKLNLFLGVPVLNKEFLPEHLNHLTSFFTQKPVSLLFPLAVTAATVVTTLLVAQSLTGDARAFATTGYTLLASLLALGVLEHWFMVLPLPIAALWSWGLRSRTGHVSDASVVSLVQNTRVRSVVTKASDP